MKTYDNYRKNRATRRQLEKQGHGKIKIQDGEVVRSIQTENKKKGE